MKKRRILLILFFLLAFAGMKSYGQNYYPDTVMIDTPRDYCIGAAAEALTCTINTALVGGATATRTVTVNWYYHLNTNSNIPVGAPIFSATVNTVTVPGFLTTVPTGPTPSTAIADAYFYFCEVSWLNAAGVLDSIVSQTCLILVGPPVFEPFSVSVSPNPICSGDPVTFTAAAYGSLDTDLITYKWIGPGTSGFFEGANPPPFTVNMADSGIFTLQATNNCGTASTTLNLTVNVNTSAISITPTTADTICQGTMITLGATCSGGSGVTYLWQGPDGYTSTLLNPPSFTATTLNTGIYTFTATALGCPPKTDTSGWIQVDSLPLALSAIVSPDTICTRYLVHLQDTTFSSPGTRYAWTGPNGYSSTLKNPFPFQASLADTGKYYLTVSNICGTKNDSTLKLYVRPTPAPILGLDTSVCLGTDVSIQFTDTTVGGYWSSSDPFIATVNPVGAVTATLAPGTVIIYYSYPSSCYDSVIVHVGMPVGPITGKKTLCVGDSTQLHDATPGGIWTVSPTSWATVGARSGEVVGVSVGTPTVTYQTPGCPIATFNMNIIPSPDPIIGSTTLCVGAVTTLFDATAGPTWSLYNTTVVNFVSDAGNTAIIQAFVPGVDTVYYRASNGCEAITVIHVDTSSPVKIYGPDSICAGACAILHVDSVAHATYQWKPGTGISCVNCDSVLACPNTNESYTVVVTNAYGCKDSSVHNLVLNPLPILGYSPSPFFLCKGSTKQIFVIDSIASNATSTYSWYPNDSISNIHVPNPFLSDTIDIVYTVTGTSRYGCKDSIKVPVSVLDSAATYITPDTIICIGAHKDLMVTSTDPRSTFTWYVAGKPGDTSLSSYNSTNPVAKPDISTTYSCFINENACFSVTREVTVYVDPMPTLAITPHSPITLIAGTVQNLTVEITNQDTGYLYEWTPQASVVCPSCASTNVTATDSNNWYHVCVESNRGCWSCDSVQILLICNNSQVFIPNTFTPNGDGQNDKFIVSGKGIGYIAHMVVFNRWGQTMYEAFGIPANDFTYGWDGTFKGQVLEPDVFMYYIDVVCEVEGTHFVFHGDISLVK